MKAIALAITIALLGSLSFSSLNHAADTRELQCEADQNFPKRRCVVDFVEGQPHGKLKAFDDKDRLIVEEDYVHGKVHGKRICYYPSGKKFSEMTFVDGLAEGPTTGWYENGNIRMTDEMSQGLPNGLQIQYFSDGTKASETPTVNAVRHGTCKHYLPNGQLFGYSQFENGVEIGRQILIEPTASDYHTIVEHSKLSPWLPDYWPSDSRRTINTAADLKEGDHASVEWKGTWYPAKILRIDKRGYYIHYTGFDDSWNEYVGENRIKPADT